VKVRLRDRLVYWIARAAIGAAARVPQWFGYGLAALLGRAFFWCAKRRRGYALRLLRNAFPGRPDGELLRLGARATGNLFKVPLDMARLTRLLARGGDVRSVVDFAAAKAQLARLRQPYVGLTAHVGSWEVAAVCMAQRSHNAHGVARVARNPLLQRWILHNRERGGLHIHPRRGGIRALANAIAAGGVGLQVVDQNQRLRGVFAPFFGEVASCERAAVSLALRRGLQVVVGGAVRTGIGFRFRFVADEPSVLERTGDRRRDLHVAVGAVNRRIEWLIRQAPEQYLWIHDRYRTQPPAGGAAGDADDEADDEPDDAA
jgi:KDO2-lipid IV(A) lauroyltransferase